MDNKKTTQMKPGHSVLPASPQKGRTPYQRLRGRSFWWLAVGFTDLYLFPVVILDRFQSSSLAFRLLFANFVFSIGIMAYALRLSMKEHAAFVAATLNAPQAKDLPKYLEAFVSCDGKAEAQSAQIICELLGCLSTEELACISNLSWRYICPSAQDTRSGYPNKKQKDLCDPVLVAGFSAIMRLKRVESLPNIESWINHRNVNRHSKDFVRTLQECHQTLLNHQAILQHSSTLLRPSSAESVTSDVLLRPIAGTDLSETGDQLLRASTRQTPGISDWNETSLPTSAATDVLQSEPGPTVIAETC